MLHWTLKIKINKNNHFLQKQQVIRIDGLWNSFCCCIYMKLEGVMYNYSTQKINILSFYWRDQKFEDIIIKCVHCFLSKKKCVNCFFYYININKFTFWSSFFFSLLVAKREKEEDAFEIKGHERHMTTTVPTLMYYICVWTF